MHGAGGCGVRGQQWMRERGKVWLQEKQIVPRLGRIKTIAGCMHGPCRMCPHGRVRTCSSSSSWSISSLDSSCLVLHAA